MKKTYILPITILSLSAFLFSSCFFKPSETTSSFSSSSEQEVINLISIEVKNPKTSYEIGDSFVKPTVIAYYDNDTNEDVTKLSTFIGFDSSTAGTRTITVAYLNKSAKYIITVKEEGQIDPEPPAEYVHGKTIIQCFNWSMNNIKSNLDNIKNAGFDTIQISPMQPQKDPYSGNWRDQWWKLYQPLGFKVATGSENKLGNKNDLISLCQAAEEKGIDVIVDVVANHLASENCKLSPAVKNFEPEIYNNNLIHNTGKKIEQDVIKGNMGELCDLMTEDSRVQNRVLSLLKEYVDCGIDGFRFDAAKHIETEFDTSAYRSDFWKNTLDATISYAKQTYDRDLFSYGEILGTVGTGRKYSYYTCRIGITDSDQGSDVLYAARGNISYVSEAYKTKENPSSLVLWAESHDTYSNSWGETKNDTLETIQKGYLMQASRKDTSILYFPRPLNNTNFGDVGDTSYKNTEVKMINAFRDKYANKNETVSANNGCFVNVRGSSGAVIVRLSGTSSTVEVPGLANGSYKDTITNSVVNVNNGKISFDSSKNYLILESDNQEDVTMPTLDVNYEEVYSGSQNISVVATNATSVTYSINKGSEQTLGGSSLNLSSSLANGKINIKIKAQNENGSTSKEINLVKTDALAQKELIITDVDSDYTYFLWAWNDNASGWKTTTMEGDIIGCDLNGQNMFTVVKFNKNVTTPNWSDYIEQTIDYSKTQRVYSYKDFTIK